MNSEKTWVATFWRGNSQLKNCGYYTTREFQAVSHKAAEKQAERYIKNVVHGSLNLISIELKQENTAMKKISIKSKQAQNWLAAYNASKYSSVEQAYANPSNKKIEADRECWKRCQREYGFNYKIISANRNYFTAAWMVYGENLRVETVNNSYIIKL